MPPLIAKFNSLDPALGLAIGLSNHPYSVGELRDIVGLGVDPPLQAPYGTDADASRSRQNPESPLALTSSLLC